MKRLYIASLDSDTFEDTSYEKIWMQSDTWLDSPGINVNAYQVPGRDGSLISKPNGFGNVIRKFDMLMPKYVDYNFRTFKKRIYWKQGYMKIKSDYENRYSVGYLAQDINVEPFNAEGDASAKFSVYFSCKPQKYALSASDKTASKMVCKRYPAGSATGEDCELFVYDRNSAFIQGIFANLPAAEIPDVEYFGALDMSTAQSGINTNDAYGTQFVALVESEVPYPKTVLNFIVSDPNTLPVTTASASQGGHLYLVVAMPHMDLRIRVKHNSSVTADYSITPTGAYSEGYTGNDIEKIRLRFKYTSTYSATNMPSYVYIFTRVTNPGSTYTYLNEAFITLCRDGYPVDTYSDYLYTEDGETYFDIVLNAETQSAYLVKDGLADVSANDFVEIHGKIGGLGYYCSCRVMSNNSKYYLDKGTFTMRGWDL